MNRTRARRWQHALAALAVATLGLAGVSCGGGGYGPGVSLGVGPVGSVWGPYWYPATYGTVAYVHRPWWGDPPANDPRQNDSPTRRAIAEQVHTAFTSRGYRTVASDGDVDVAVYASSEPELDIAQYTRIYDWKNLPKLKDQNRFPKGTVILDVLQPKTHVLLWRGHTVAPVSDDVDEYSKNLRGAVDRIVEKYPTAKKR